MVLSIYENVIENIYLSVVMLCNVIDSSNIDKDMMQFMNDPYKFSLFPCILVYKVRDFEFCHA